MHNMSSPLSVKIKSETEFVSNGTSSPHGKPNGKATVKGEEAVPNRKQRRKEWWDKQNTSSEKNMPNEAVKSHADSRRMLDENGDQHTMKDEPNDDHTSTEQRSKLRNRNTIAKPDSLKYEHDYNRGFHSKLMQNLFTEAPKKQKKRGKDNKKAPAEAQKRKPSSTAGMEPEGNKKPKPAEEGEIVDLYKFSLNLINGEVDTSKTTTSKDSKNKYVLFIGNLPYDITREQLEEHFRKTGGIKSIRIPREKVTDKGRGFAYMEFDGRISHGIALRLHHTTLGGRKINVEFTSIGGGKSEARKAKLQKKNSKRRKINYH